MTISRTYALKDWVKNVFIAVTIPIWVPAAFILIMCIVLSESIARLFFDVEEHYIEPEMW